MEMACWAAWSMRPSQKHSSNTIFVQGENEDYVSDLSEEIAVVCNAVPTFRPPGRVMNLLNHLDNQGRFAKFMKRIL